MATPTEQKTPEEISAFLSRNDISFDEIDDALSSKTNFLIFVTNFKALTIYLKQMLSFVKNLYLILDVSVIVGNVLESLENSKPEIKIVTTQEIGNTSLQSFGTLVIKSYNVLRVDAYTFEITKFGSPNWVTKNLIIQSKAVGDSQIVYPTIRTANNKITVTYHDAVLEDYSVIFV